MSILGGEENASHSLRVVGLIENERDYVFVADSLKGAGPHRVDASVMAYYKKVEVWVDGYGPVVLDAP